MTDDKTPDPAPASLPHERTGLRHRVLGLRAVAAVVLAALILGGLGGAAIGVLSTNGNDDDRRGPGGRGGPGDGPGHGQDVRPGQGLPPGGVPPTTTPDDEVEPDAPATPSGDTNA